MSVRTGKRCYVSMPFGVRGGIDFDLVYHRAIVPALAEVDVVAVRGDSLLTRGAIQNAIFEAVLGADLMIADISLGDSNVWYELGIRHVARPSGTIVISSDERIPVDIQAVQVLGYVPGEDGLDALSTALVRALWAAAEGHPDSPVRTLFPDLSVSLPTTIPSRGQEDFLRRRLLEAQRLAGSTRLDELRAIEAAILGGGAHDRSLLTDLMFAYRDASAWDDVVRVASTFPSDLQNSTEVMQQVALALNRSGDPVGAELQLRKLLDRGDGDSETFGLLGRLYKDRWRQTGARADLDRAIDAYRAGLRSDPSDYYPGINLATLLAVRGDPEAHAELEALLPELRELLNKLVTAGQADYWQLATSLELAVLAGDLPSAAELVEPVLARAAAPWMTETTVANLLNIADVQPGGADPELSRIIDRLREGAKIGGPR